MNGILAIVFSISALAVSGVGLLGCTAYAMFVDGGITTSRLRGDVYGLAVVFGMAVVLAFVSFNSTSLRWIGVASYRTGEVADSVALISILLMFLVWYLVARGMGAPSVLWGWFAEAFMTLLFRK